MTMTFDPCYFEPDCLSYGAYISEDDRKFVEEKFPDLKQQWDAWLDAQRDPGHYEAYKVKDPSVLPYVDGQPQWVCDVFMPGSLLVELKRRLS